MTHLRALSSVLGLALTAMTTTMPVPCATANTSAVIAARLTALYAGPGVIFRAPENCVGDVPDPWTVAAVVQFCAVKDVLGALGGPSSGAAPTDYVAMPERFEFQQPLDCDSVGAVADGKHDGCAVVTGAATLLRSGLPVRLFGVCANPSAHDCGVLGTITDPNWTPDGVYLLMDPATVRVFCQYAQDAGRNGCNENEAHTAGRTRPSCSLAPADRRCQYGPDERERMLAAYADYCSAEPANCQENQIEAQWARQSVLAVGYLNRGDQPVDCATARAKAASFAAAVDVDEPAGLPLVQVFLDVARNTMAFADAATGCELLQH